MHMPWQKLTLRASRQKAFQENTPPVSCVADRATREPRGAAWGFGDSLGPGTWAPHFDICPSGQMLSVRGLNVDRNFTSKGKVRRTVWSCPQALDRGSRGHEGDRQSPTAERASGHAA